MSSQPVTHVDFPFEEVKKKIKGMTKYKSECKQTVTKQKSKPLLKKPTLLEKLSSMKLEMFREKINCEPNKIASRNNTCNNLTSGKVLY